MQKKVFSLLLPLVLVWTIGCDRKQAAVNVQAPAVPVAPAPPPDPVGIQNPVPPGNSISTKQAEPVDKPYFIQWDPNFRRFENPEIPDPDKSSDSFYSTYSQSYRNALQDIEKKTAGITNPELKRAEANRLQEQIDKSKYRGEAEKDFSASKTKYKEDRRQFFDNHANGWFSIGKLESYELRDGVGRLHFETEKNPKTVKLVELNITISELDKLLFDFKQIATPNIQKYVRYRQLDDEFVQRGRGSDPDFAARYWEIGEKNERHNLILVGKGNFLTKVAHEFAIAESITPSILLKFDKPPAITKTQLHLED